MMLIKKVYQNQKGRQKLVHAINLFVAFLALTLVIGCSGVSDVNSREKTGIENEILTVENPLGRNVDDSLYFRWFVYNLEDSLDGSDVRIDSPLKKGLKNTAIIMNSGKITDTLAVMPFYKNLIIEEDWGGGRWYSKYYIDQLNFFELFSLYHFILKFESGKTKNISNTILINMEYSMRKTESTYSNILFNIELYYYYSYLEDELDNFNRYSDSLLVIYPDWKYLKEYKNNIPKTKAEWK